LLVAFTWSEFAEQVVAGLGDGSVYASLALALVLIYRTTRVINFAQGEMATFTTFIAWSLMNHGLSFWAAFPVVLAIAFAGGVAGMMVAPIEFLGPGMMQAVLLYAFAAAILGGLDSPVGAVAGGLLLGLAIDLLGRYVPYIDSTLKLPAALFLILLVLLVRPAGLF